MGRIEETEAMKDALTEALRGGTKDASVDRILADAFFRKRPLQAGAQARDAGAQVIRLDERRNAGSRR